ncbi:helix-turn-helix domain-containing protein [Lentilactobacillus hilgardii]|nr:helix-turn-helix transcriptional regulator [Lentilactobacillus hilgardii]MBZ2202553.1 hypothetical protein [Lentilactobacillus hilgardii]MBZ2205514.1 hypothetical protein [Lentilactobacillus hilgardii]
MLYVNLNEILEDKGITINQLSKLTGINRNSLASLANNKSAMVQFGTLNKLLVTLDVKLEELLQYVPDLDFKIEKSDINEVSSRFTTSLKFNKSNKKLNLYGEMTETNDIYKIKWPLFTSKQEQSNSNLFTEAFLNALPKPNSQGNLPNDKSIRDNVAFVSNKLFNEAVLPFFVKKLIPNTHTRKLTRNILAHTPDHPLFQLPVYNNELENSVVIIEFQLDFLIKEGIKCPSSIRITYDYEKMQRLLHKTMLSILNVSLEN